MIFVYYTVPLIVMILVKGFTRGYLPAKREISPSAPIRCCGLTRIYLPPHGKVAGRKPPNWHEVSVLIPSKELSERGAFTPYRPVTLGFWKMVISLAPLSQGRHFIISGGGNSLPASYRNGGLRYISVVWPGPDRLVVVYIRKQRRNKAAFVIVDSRYVGSS